MNFVNSFLPERSGTIASRISASGTDRSRSPGWRAPPRFPHGPLLSEFDLQSLLDHPRVRLSPRLPHDLSHEEGEQAALAGVVAFDLLRVRGDDPVHERLDSPRVGAL